MANTLFEQFVNSGADNKNGSSNTPISSKKSTLFDAYNTVNKSNTSSVVNNVDNATQKLNAIGVDSTKITDTRNPLEKFLNLTPDQNFVMDIFEVIGRPQQAIFGAIDAAQTGKDVGKAAMEGLTGENYTYGGDIIRNLGIGDDKSFGLDDVVGFGLDIFADPADLMTFGVSSVSDIGKVIGRQSKAVSNVNNLINTGQALDKSGNTIKNMNDFLNLADSGQLPKRLTPSNELLNVLKTGKDKTSLTEAVFRGGFQGAKKGIGLADKGVTTGLKALDDSLKWTSADTYSDFKKGLEQAFNAGKNIPKAISNAFYKVKGDASITDDFAKITLKQLDDEILKGNEFYKANGISGDYAEDISKWQAMKETQGLEKINGDDLFYLLEEGVLPTSMKYGDNVFQNLQKLIDEGAAKGYKVQKDMLERGTVTYPNSAGEIVEGIKLNKTQVEELKELMEDPELDIFFKEKVYNNPFMYTENSPQFQEVVSRLMKTPEGSARITQNISFEDTIKNTIKEKMGTSDVFEDTFYNRRKAKDTYANKVKGTVADTLSTRKRTGFMTPEDFNAYKKDTFDLVYTGSHGNKWTNKDIAELRKIVDDGVLETSISSTIPDFAKKYSDNVTQSTVLDRALLMPFYDDAVGLSEDYSKLGKLETEVYNNPDPLKSLELQKQLDDYNEVVKTKLTDSIIKPKALMEKGADGKVMIPKGFVEVDPATFDNKLKKIEKYVKQGNEFKKIKSAFTTGAFKDGFVIQEQMNNMVNLMSDKSLQNEAVQSIMKVADATQNLFKTTKLLSPGYNIRNVVGAVTNMAFSGVPITKMPELYKEAIKTERLYTSALEKVANGKTLSEVEQKAYDTFTRFRQYGFARDSGLKVMDVESFLVENPVNYKDNALGKVAGVKDAIIDANLKANMTVDTWSRLATMQYFESNPSKMLSNGFTTPGEAVRWAMFDPEDLSRAETDFFKKLIPFYTFTKKNLAYQFSNLGTNPKYYNRFINGMESLWDSVGVSKDDLQDYQRNGAQIPIPGISDSENIFTLKANAPVSDLFEWISDPVGKVATSSSPLIRAPIEYATGTQAFSGLPISNYEGEMSKTIPFLEKETEWALGNLGLDVPIRTGVNLFNALANPSASSVANASGVIGSTSLSDLQNSKAYQDLNALNDYIKKLEAEGVDVPTMSELENKDKSLEQTNALIDQILSQYK